MALSPFLALPQEIRDVIYEFAVDEDVYDPDFVRVSWSKYRTKGIAIGNSTRWQWKCHHTSKAPIPEYLCLMLCNRQLNREIRDFLRRSQHDPARMVLLLDYPNMWPTSTRMSEPPWQTTTLELLVKVHNVYHPAFISRGSQNAILAAISDTLKRYVHRGPHLSRPSPLSQPYHLETVRITLAPLVPISDVREIYGYPAQQLESLFNDFKALLIRFCRSGLPYGSINFFEVRMEGQKYDRLPVTSNLWDEEDFMLFQYAGFNWDGGLDASDTVSYEPDLIPW